MQAQSQGFTTNAVRALAIVVGITALCIVGVFIAASIAGVVGKFNPSYVLLTIQIVAFAAALFTLPIGALGCIYWTIRFGLAETVRSDIKLRRYWFNKNNALFVPSILTPQGLSIRQKFLTALSYALVGVFFGLLTFALSQWTPWKS